VVPIRFAGLCEEICDHPVIRRDYPQYAHKMYHIFLCETTQDTPAAPTQTDIMQKGSVWIDISRIGSLHFLPEALNGHLEEMIKNPVPLFLGSTHDPYHHG